MVFNYSNIELIDNLCMYMCEHLIIAKTINTNINIYLKHTKSTGDIVFKWIDVMILREHFFNKDTNAVGFEAARARHYDYIVHSVPDMLKRWNTSI